MRKPTLASGRIPAKGPNGSAKIAQKTPMRPGAALLPFTPLKPVTLPPLPPSRLSAANAFIASGLIGAAAADALSKAVAGEALSSGEVESIASEFQSNPALQTGVAQSAFGPIFDEFSGGGGEEVTPPESFSPPMIGSGGSGGGGPAYGNPGSPPVTDDPPVGPETGMKIVEVLDRSAAKNSDLRANDIIYEVGGKRVRNYDEYRTAMTAVKGTVEVVFYNAETKQLETLKVTPQGGLLGAVMVEAYVPE